MDVADSLVAHNSIRRPRFRVTTLISLIVHQSLKPALICHAYNLEDLTHFYEIMFNSELIGTNDNEFIFNDVKDYTVLNLSVL